MIWIYDIETFINFFCVTFKNPKSQEIKKFIIFEDVNQGGELVNFMLSNTLSWFIGYNSYTFDNQLLNYIYKTSFDMSMLSSDELSGRIFNLAMMIINEKYHDLKYDPPFRHIDLMKMGRYKKSLKLLGVSLKWSKLQDLPVPTSSIIKKDQVETILKYNLNDVLITEQLYNHLKNSIKFRHELSEAYEIDLYNESDTGIADRLLEKFYSESTGQRLRDFKDLRTERKFVKFDWVVFKDIDFKTPELISLLESVRNFTYYKDHPFFKKKFEFMGTTYKMGIGGLHSVDGPGLFEETDDTCIVDADIGSMYPTTLINHECTPEHLGKKFLRNFIMVRNNRLEEKVKGNKTKSEGLKLIMNAAIGKTLNKYSFLYDPLVNLQITVNGQLYILMLIEELALNGFEVISANTDGITTIVKRSRIDEYYKICKEWELKHRYTLEYVFYKKYVRRDVNNYLAIKENGEVKEKGVFTKSWPKNFNNSTDPLARGWDKPIVSKALYDFFVNNIPIQQTISDCTDIHDFCIAKRIDDKFTNEFHTIKNGEYQKEILQRSVRYYVSRDGGVLLKTCEEESKTSNYEATKRVTIFNDYIDIPNFREYNVDYAYYVNSAQKIIDLIINPQLTLF